MRIQKQTSTLNSKMRIIYYLSLTSFSFVHLSPFFDALHRTASRIFRCLLSMGGLVWRYEWSRWVRIDCIPRWTIWEDDLMIVMDFMRLLSLGCVFGRLFSPFLMFFLLHHVPIVTPHPNTNDRPLRCPSVTHLVRLGYYDWHFVQSPWQRSSCFFFFPLSAHLLFPLSKALSPHPRTPLPLFFASVCFGELCSLSFASDSYFWKMFWNDPLHRTYVLFHVSCRKMLQGDRALTDGSCEWAPERALFLSDRIRRLSSFCIVEWKMKLSPF